MLLHAKHLVLMTALLHPGPGSTSPMHPTPASQASAQGSHRQLLAMTQLSHGRGVLQCKVPSPHLRPSSALMSAASWPQRVVPSPRRLEQAVATMAPKQVITAAASSVVGPRNRWNDPAVYAPVMAGGCAAQQQGA